MTNAQERLKLGKGVRFVKTHLRRLAACDETWEADFLRALGPHGVPGNVWHGLVVTHDGHILAERTVEVQPTVNDIADLLALAMLHPSDEIRRRPKTLRIRKRHEWQELLPHLQEIVERVVSAPRLARWDKEFKVFCREMARFEPATKRPAVDDLFPATAEWVRTVGYIEIGDQQGFGFIVRALDYGGLVFEDRNAKTLGEALSALEKHLVRDLDR